MTPDELHQLLGAYLSAEATPDEAAQVDDLLRSDPAAAEELAQLALVEAGLHTLRCMHPWPAAETSPAAAAAAEPSHGATSAASLPSASPVRPGSTRHDPRTQPRRRWLAAALTFTVLALSVLGGREWIDRRKIAPIAAAGSIEGGVFLARNGTSSPLGAGDPIFPGDRIETDEGASCSIEYPDERTLLQLGARSAILFEPQKFRTSRQKNLSLPVGEVSIEAAPQPKGLPLILRTPHARLTVLGTRFTTATNGQRTATMVDSGMVRFERHGDPIALDLGAGRLGVTGSDVSTRSYPAMQFPSARALLEAQNLANTPAIRHHWTFDHHLRDGAGDAHLSIPNVQYRPGRHGDAVLIDSGYGIIGPELDLGSRFEIQAWIYLPDDQIVPDRRTLVCNGESGDLKQGFRLFLYLDAQGRRTLQLETGNELQGSRAHSVPNVIHTRQWHHIRVRIDRPAASARLFVDQKDVTHPQFRTVRSDFSTRGRLRIGAMARTPYLLNGLIDELTISSFQP